MITRDLYEQKGGIIGIDGMRRMGGIIRMDGWKKIKRKMGEIRPNDARRTIKKNKKKKQRMMRKMMRMMKTT